MTDKLIISQDETENKHRPILIQSSKNLESLSSPDLEISQQALKSNSVDVDTGNIPTNNNEDKGNAEGDNTLDGKTAFKLLNDHLNLVVNQAIKPIIDQLLKADQKTANIFLQQSRNPNYTIIIESLRRKLLKADFSNTASPDPDSLKSLLSDAKEMINSAIEPTIIQKLLKINPDTDLGKVATNVYQIAVTNVNRDPIIVFIGQNILKWKAEIQQQRSALFDKPITKISTSQTKENDTDKLKKETTASETKSNIAALETTSPVVDQEKENLYKKIIDQLSSLPEDKLQSWILLVFNQYQKLNNLPLLNPEDISEITFLKATSTSASEIAGTPILRPLFIFFNNDQYQNFLKKVGASGADGFVRNLTDNDSGIDWELIVSSNKINAVAHEIRHSIDFNLNERKGAGQLIGELFTKYYDHVGQYKQNISEQNWQKLQQIMSSEYYFQQLLNNSPEITGLSIATYKEIIALMVDQVRLCYEKCQDHILVQRLMLSSTTLQELLQKIEK